jgi:hypothetical protein
MKPCFVEKHASGQSHKGKKMLNSPGIEAFQDFHAALPGVRLR